MQQYVGRFAPSPTGPLHAGSLVAALASWLDARAHGGRWLVRIEDVDVPRCVDGADHTILQQLADCGLTPDEPPLYQSRRSALYQRALDMLVEYRQAYGCACSRKDIEAELHRLGRDKPRHGELVYPGTCRPEHGGLHGKPARAWRLQVVPGTLLWNDRRLGPQAQDVEAEVGDFVLRRADGWFAYQLAVVADDGVQSVTDVVRGEDLADNTARQILLQAALGLPRPRYLHTPLVLDPKGEKLSKQNGAQALDTREPLAALNAAAAVLGLQVGGSTVGDWLASATQQWAERWGPTGKIPE
jgi:glutamyl-Q tRNA(Asp) synthetase